MKKNVLVLLFVAATSVAMHAQSFGVKTGLSLAKITDDSSSKTRTGFVGGVYTNFNLGESFSIQPELLYSAQGSKFSSDGYNGKIIFDYLTLPIMFQYAVVDGLYLQAGPQIGFVVKDTTEVEGLGSIDTSDSLKLLGEKLNTFDFGFNFGAGYKTNFGLNFDARYNLGLNDIIKNVKGKNQVIQLTVGYDIVKPK
ncbi:MAG: porin family protein [Solirubrobacteraceae bacterium]